MVRRQHRGRWTATALSIVAAGCFLAIARPSPAEPGDIALLDVSFGDSFALDWVDLQSVQGDTAEPDLLPMASADGRCIGFARTDWPQAETHPSVARCFGQPEPGTVGVRKVATGPTTWHIFVFATPVREFVVDIAGTRSTHYQGSTIAAAALPAGVDEVQLEWTEFSGRRFEAALTETNR